MELECLLDEKLLDDMIPLMILAFYGRCETSLSTDVFLIWQNRSKVSFYSSIHPSLCPV